MRLRHDFCGLHAALAPFKLFFAVILPIVYTVTAMPINLFFISSSSFTWNVIDTFVSVLFGVDITLQFFSAYIDESGILVTDRCALSPSASVRLSASIS